MTSNPQDLRTSLSREQKVVLALEGSRHVRSALPRQVNEAVTLALDIARAPRARSDAIYRQIHPLLAFESGLKGIPRAKSALFAASTALYLAAWSADHRDNPPGAPRLAPSLPNDVADVDEDYLEHCLGYARAAATDGKLEGEWQEQTALGLAGTFSKPC